MAASGAVRPGPSPARPRVTRNERVQTDVPCHGADSGTRDDSPWKDSTCVRWGGMDTMALGLVGVSKKKKKKSSRQKSGSEHSARRLSMLDCSTAGKCAGCDTTQRVKAGFCCRYEPNRRLFAHARSRAHVLCASWPTRCEISLAWSTMCEPRRCACHSLG